MADFSEISAARCSQCAAWNDSHTFPVACYRCGSMVVLPQPEELRPKLPLPRPEGNQFLLLAPWGRAYLQAWTRWVAGAADERPNLASFRVEGRRPSSRTTTTRPGRLWIR